MNDNSASSYDDIILRSSFSIHVGKACTGSGEKDAPQNQILTKVDDSIAIQRTLVAATCLDISNRW